MNRVFLKDFNGSSTSDPGAIHQLRNVLRVRAGDALLAFDGRREWTLRVENVARDAYEFSVLAERDAPVGPRVTLMQALLKKDRWELLLEKMTELGATEIAPVRASRCVAKADDADAKLERWERIMERAVAQCRGAAPRLLPPAPLADRLARDTAALRLICADIPEAAPILDALAAAGRLDEVEILVGPEGDFMPEEIAAALDAGFIPVSLGPRVLRAETAASVALAAVMLYNNRGKIENTGEVPGSPELKKKA